MIETIDPSAVVAPAGPVPMAAPTAAVEIPDGEPAAGALALLNLARPDAPDILRSRSDQALGRLGVSSINENSPHSRDHLEAGELVVLQEKGL
jgi:hypothetical protein